MLNIRDTERIHIWSEGRQCIQKDDRLLWKVSQLSSHAAFHLNCQIACRTSEKSSADIRSRTQELRLRGKTVCSERDVWQPCAMHDMFDTRSSFFRILTASSCRRRSRCTGTFANMTRVTEAAVKTLLHNFLV